MKVKKLLSKMLVDTDCVQFVIQKSNETKITTETSKVFMVRDARNKYNQDFYSLKVKGIRPIHNDLMLPDFQDYIKIIIDYNEVDK